MGEVDAGAGANEFEVEVPEPKSESISFLTSFLAVSAGALVVVGGVKSREKRSVRADAVASAGACELGAIEGAVIGVRRGSTREGGTNVFGVRVERLVRERELVAGGAAAAVGRTSWFFEI